MDGALQACNNATLMNTMIPMEAHGWAHVCEKKLFLNGKEHHVMEFWVGLYP